MGSPSQPNKEGKINMIGNNQEIELSTGLRWILRSIQLAYYIGALIMIILISGNENITLSQKILCVIIVGFATAYVVIMTNLNTRVKVWRK